MMMNQLQTVAEIKKLQPGETFKSILVVGSLFQKSDKNGKPYYEMSAMDSTGTIEAKIWSDAVWFDRSGEDPTASAVKLPDEEIRRVAGKTLGIDGKTAEFRGQLQFNFNKMTLLNQERFPAAQYLPRSPIPISDLEARFENLLKGCRPEVGDLLKTIFSGTLWSGFRDWPAAVSHHHAYANGLLEHTLAVADCAKAMAESFVNSGYALDVDIVVAGALLHDLGKLESYRMGSIPEMTLEGAVLDHVALGYARFTELAAKVNVPQALKLHLSHILLSHHGLKEYGSPVLPATPEALIVSAADELDFKIFCWQDATKDLTDDQPISQWHNATGRRFWKR